MDKIACLLISSVITHVSVSYVSFVLEKSRACQYKRPNAFFSIEYTFESVVFYSCYLCLKLGKQDYLYFLIFLVSEIGFIIPVFDKILSYYRLSHKQKLIS